MWNIRAAAGQKSLQKLMVSAGFALLLGPGLSQASLADDHPGTKTHHCRAVHS